MINQNKRVKVFYMGQRLKDMYPHATAWQMFKYRLYRLCIKTLWILAITVLVIAIFEAGNLFGPKTVITLPPTQVIKEVPVKLDVMTRIAKCESQGSHYAKNGQVLVAGNKNGSVDVGLYQINTIWFAEATDMGLNLFIEQDNITFANHLLNKYGTEPWVWSKPCWNK